MSFKPSDIGKRVKCTVKSSASPNKGKTGTIISISSTGKTCTCSWGNTTGIRYDAIQFLNIDNIDDNEVDDVRLDGINQEDRMSTTVVTTKFSEATSLMDAAASLSTGETKSGEISTKSSTTTAKASAPVFYGSTFKRPTTIPKDLFKESVQAMKDGIQRNPFAHWNDKYKLYKRLDLKWLGNVRIKYELTQRGITYNEMEGKDLASLKALLEKEFDKEEKIIREWRLKHTQPECKHEIPRHTLSNCADCRKEGVLLGQRLKDEEAHVRKIKDDDRKLCPTCDKIISYSDTSNDDASNTDNDTNNNNIGEQKESQEYVICYECLENTPSNKKMIEKLRDCSHYICENCQLKSNKSIVDCPHITMLHQCGVTVDFLLAFTFDHDCWDKKTYWVSRHIIKEATRKTRKRYMHLEKMRKYSHPAKVFVSHPWAANWGDLVLSACHGARSDRVVWIDLFAARQWPGNRMDLNFRGVLSRCQSLLVSVSRINGLMDPIPHDETSIHDFFKSDIGKKAKKQTPFFRLWCIVEITDAIKKGIPLVVKAGSVKKVHNNQYSYTKFDSGLMTNLQFMMDVENSETSDPNDKKREMKVIRTIGSDRVNKLLSGVITGASSSIINNVKENDAFIIGEKEALLSMDLTDKSILRTVLAVACAGGRIKIVQFLLDSGHVNGYCINQSRSLLSAANGDHTDVIKILINVKDVQEPVDINIEGWKPHNRTALYLACENNHLDVVKLLVKHPNIDVNKSTSNGTTPLFVASKFGFIDIVRELLKHNKININSTRHVLDIGKMTNAQLVDEIKRYNFAAKIEDEKDIENRPFPVKKDLIKRLGEKRFNAHGNEQIRGCTPLIAARQNDHTDIVQLLLNNEAEDLTSNNVQYYLANQTRPYVGNQWIKPIPEREEDILHIGELVKYNDKNYVIMKFHELSCDRTLVEFVTGECCEQKDIIKLHPTEFMVGDVVRIIGDCNKGYRGVIERIDKETIYLTRGNSCSLSDIEKVSSLNDFKKYDIIKVIGGKYKGEEHVVLDVGDVMVFFMGGSCAKSNVETIKGRYQYGNPLIITVPNCSGMTKNGGKCGNSGSYDGYCHLHKKK
jgi:hypothetical protein